MSRPFFALENGGIAHGHHQHVPQGADIASEVRAIHAKLDAVLSGLAGIAFKKESTARQAKRLGISVRTLNARKQRARLQAIVEEVRRGGV